MLGHGGCNRFVRLEARQSLDYGAARVGVAMSQVLGEW
jgi:hypothetical protein